MIQDSFWTHDYSSGVEALKNSLRGGMLENKQFLAMIRERARIEHLHASQLAHLSQDPAIHMSGQPQQDSVVTRSSTLQASLDAFNAENVNSAVLLTRIATEIEKKVHEPLDKWCKMYATKVEACLSKLGSLVARYQRLLQEARKQRTVYYERCRRNEDRSGDNSPRDPVISTIRMLRERLNSKRESTEAQQAAKPVEFTIAGLEYTRQQLADLLYLMLNDVTLSEYKVPLLGSYHNVCSGSTLATAARRHLRNDSFAYTEKFGQSLVDQGFLKPVGQISNKFQSTHTTHYQWQALAFELLEDASDESELEAASNHTSSDVASSNSAGSANTSMASVLAASDASEEHYLQAVLELDVYRCEMEIEMMQIYEFLDRLALDRERALQAGMKDFIHVAFRLEDQREMQLRLNAAQAAVNPELDLADLVARYETGPFIPSVTVFRGYYNDSVAQTFGVDLEHSRFFVDLTISWLQAHNKEASELAIWTKPEPIREAYKLRAQVNTGRVFNAESIYKFFSPSVVVSVFIHFLLELPESLVPFTVYDRVKHIYSSHEHSSTDDLVSTLIQIPVENQKVLRQIIEYLRSVFVQDELKDDALNQLARSLALPIVRPRAPSSVTMHDPQPRLLVYDLLSRGPEVFEALALQQQRAEEQKEAHPPRIQRNPHTSYDVSAPAPESESPTPGSRRVVSASTLRPLALASPRGALRANSSEAADDSTFTPVRGLGINSMLPIVKSPTATPPMSPKGSPSPQQTSSPGLRPLRMSNLDLDNPKLRS